MSMPQFRLRAVHPSSCMRYSPPSFRFALIVPHILHFCKLLHDIPWTILLPCICSPPFFTAQLQVYMTLQDNCSLKGQNKYQDSPGLQEGLGVRTRASRRHTPALASCLPQAVVCARAAGSILDAIHATDAPQPAPCGSATLVWTSPRCAHSCREPLWFSDCLAWVSHVAPA